MFYMDLKHEREENAIFRMLVSYALYDDLCSIGLLIDEIETFDSWSAVRPFLETDASIAALLKQRKVYDLSQKIVGITEAYEEDLINFQEFVSEMEKIKKEINFMYLADPEVYLDPDEMT